MSCASLTLLLCTSLLQITRDSSAIGTYVAFVQLSRAFDSLTFGLHVPASTLFLRSGASSIRYGKRMCIICFGGDGKAAREGGRGEACRSRRSLALTFWSVKRLMATVFSLCV